MAKTLTVMGVTLADCGEDTWKSKVGADSDVMAFGPTWQARTYAPSPVPAGREWGALMTSEYGDAAVRLHGHGATLEDAVRALRVALNAVTEARATIGSDLAAMLDAGEVAA